MCATRPSLCASMRARTLSSTRPSACARPAANASTASATRVAAKFVPLRRKLEPRICKPIPNKHAAGTPVPAGSLRLDAGELHHLGPFLGFRGDEIAEVGGRAQKRHRAEVGETLLERGIGEAGNGLAAELFDDRRGR